jgi:hypothetical protein
MFKEYTRKLAILALLVAVCGGVASAQGPIQKRVNFSINVPYKLRMENYTLPSGNYILHQVNANDLNLFALYQGDMQHSPIAMIRTVRRDYSARHYPDRTDIRWVIDESDQDTLPVVTGWDIPGEDGWQIIAVVPRHHGRAVLTRVR